MGPDDVTAAGLGGVFFFSSSLVVVVVAVAVGVACGENEEDVDSVETCLAATTVNAAALNLPIIIVGDLDCDEVDLEETMGLTITGGRPN